MEIKKKHIEKIESENLQLLTFYCLDTLFFVVRLLQNLKDVIFYNNNKDTHFCDHRRNYSDIKCNKLNIQILLR